MDTSAWEDPERRRLVMVLADLDGGRLAVLINADRRAASFGLPPRQGWQWQAIALEGGTAESSDKSSLVAGRSVRFAREVKG
jgi:glycogen operon protein